jgi:hypothetical protein
MGLKKKYLHINKKKKKYFEYCKYVLEQVVDIIWIIVNISINISQTIAYFNFVLYLLTIQINFNIINTC